MDSVNIDHIYKAVEDYKSKGNPKEFGPSSTYDVIINGEKYPPKSIIAYALYHATGQVPANNFSGGRGTECFNTLERLGLKIVSKKNENSVEHLRGLKESFVKRWPLEKLKDLKLEDYSSSNKDSFCYWLEQKTNDLGSARGGSSYKFGIYKMGESSEFKPGDKRRTDGEYSWLSKYGESKEETYSVILNSVNQIASLSSKGMFEEVEKIEVIGDVIKWKIAFLYSNYDLINIFKHSALLVCAKHLGYTGSDQSYTSLNNYIISKKGDQDLFEFAIKLWNVYDGISKTKELFKGWLKSVQLVESGKVSSYLRAIDILEHNLETPVYSISDLSEAQNLYEDLMLNQKDLNGKYYFSKAKSYGQGGFYSAAVGMYIEYLKTSHSSSNEELALISLIREIGQEVSVKYFELMLRILEDLDVEKGDVRIHYTFREKRKRLGLTIGQKYAVLVEVKKEINTYGYFDTIKPSDDWWNSVDSITELVKAKNKIVSSAQQEFVKTKKSGYKAHSSEILERSIFDADYRLSLFNKAFNMSIEKSPMKMDNVNSDLNQIFFGPPGTGKTFNSVNEAIKIVDPNFYEKNKNDRRALKDRFNLLLLKSDNENVGQIGFTTFHQSFSYEDFVEGIKPMSPDESENLRYYIEEGIFMRMCRIAKDSLNSKESKFIEMDKEEFDKTSFYKMSLGNIHVEEDKSLYEYCISNGCISLGFAPGLDFTDLNGRGVYDLGNKHNIDKKEIRPINAFIGMPIGSYVVVSYGNQYIRAIGKVVGGYRFEENLPFPNSSSWNHFRDVEWLYSDKHLPVSTIYSRNFQQQSIYSLDKSIINESFFVRNKDVNEFDLPQNPKNYVLIIDEINRGNVSSIFGELITLIEKDKREGKDEELSVLLPYSKKEFKVPKNLYLIGTMNTADRSVEALDAALRRRFSFTEMPPKPNLIREVGLLKDSEGKIGDIDVHLILSTINDRIEKLIDKDHKIGHSYFLNISNQNELKAVFRDKVIPLLEEYFFGDFGKISLVLGNSFITKSTKSDVSFASNNDYDPSIAEDLLEKSIYSIQPESSWDFKSIYE